MKKETSGEVCKIKMRRRPPYLRMCIQRQMNIGMTTRALCMQCSRSARFMSGSRVIVSDVMETHVKTAAEYA